MNDISNRTLSVLVILAILVSLVSLFIGRGKIVTVGRGTQTTGDITALVQSDVDIEVVGAPLDFGTVYGNDRISSNSTCVGDCSDGTGDFFDSQCVQGPLATQCNKAFPSTTNRPLNISSVGNTQADVIYKASRSLFCRTWLGIDVPGAVILEADRALETTGEDNGFEAKIAAIAATVLRPCNNGIGSGIYGIEPFAEMTWKQVDIQNDQGIVLGCVKNDHFMMYFRIRVPSNEPTSGCTHSTTLTFTGVAT